ncbi:MAG: polysaccharide biosynthesis C-terminal domain-containing protein [Acutalibacteraceae bacterium]|nr:polysaccharide biosynthesis protein [Oscillospiraceae bacterium]
MSTRKKQNLINAASVLVVSTVIVKVIGMIYKIPLVWIIGETGKGYFQQAYDIYMPFYTISMAGLPVAISRLVSESISENKFRQAQQIFKVAQKLFLAVGAFGTLLLIAIAYPYSKFLIKTPENFVSILAIAPCIFFCCMMSSYRGYYEGTRNMYPTGISQVIEASGKLILGLAMAYGVMQYGLKTFANANGQSVEVFGTLVSTEQEALSAIYPYAAAAAVFGVTVGSLCGMLYLMIRNKVTGGAFTREELINSPAPMNGRETAKKIISIAIPVAISSVVLSVSNFIDSVTVKNRLAHAMEIGASTIKQMYAWSLDTAQVLDKDIPTYLYGVYGLAIDVKNLIPTITMTLGVSVIPMLSAAWFSRDKKAVKQNIDSVFRITMLIGMPAGFGLAALSTPVMQLLYGIKKPSIVPIAGPILFAYALPMAFYAVSTPLTNMLHAVNRMDVPIKSMILGSVAKIVLNFVLVGNPNINIKGAPYSSLACYAIIVIYNLVALIRETKVKPDFVSTFLKPLISGAICGGAAYLTYSLMTNTLGRGNTLSTFVSIAVGGIIYFAVLLLIKGFAKTDIEMLPKGEKIAKVLEKLKLLG